MNSFQFTQQAFFFSNLLDKTSDSVIKAAKTGDLVLDMQKLNQEITFLYSQSLAGLEPLNIGLRRITMADYDRHHYDKELLAKTATEIGAVEVNPISDLENVRGQINKYLQENGISISADWCFVDCECANDIAIR